MHVWVAVETRNHPGFVEWITSRKYPLRGKYYTGTNTPFLTELKFYDIRIKEACKQHLLADLKHTDGMGHMGTDLHKTMRLMMNNPIMKKISPFRFDVDMSKVKRSPIDWEPFGWCYSQILATAPDDYDEHGEDML